MIEKYKNLFSEKVRDAGDIYYREGTFEVFKTNDGYFSFYIGSDEEEDCEVRISNNKLKCTCEKRGHCAHEYATLLYIDNKEYKEVELLKEDKRNLKE